MKGMVAVRDTNPRRQEVSSERLKKDSAGQQKLTVRFVQRRPMGRRIDAKQGNQLRSVP